MFIPFKQNILMIYNKLEIISIETENYRGNMNCERI